MAAAHGNGAGATLSAEIRRLRGSFALLGALSASWTVRIPAMKAKLDLRDGQLGLQVLGWGLASLVAMHFSAFALRRFGSGLMLRIFLPAVAVALVPVGLAPAFPALIVAGVLFGGCYGLAEVCASVAATTVGAVTGRPVMGSMHAAWSAGAVLGGFAGAIGAWCGLSFTAAMLVSAGAGLTLAIVSTQAAPATPSNARAGTVTVRPVRIPPVVLWLGVICACAFLAEGTIADWSAVYLIGFAGSTPALAALAYPTTEIAVIAARLAADRISGRVRIRTIIVIASVLGAAGLVVAATAGSALVALLGFLIVGSTVAVIPPVTFWAAGSVAAELRAAAVGRVSTVGYGGFLIGPVLIGLAADHFTLATALLVAAAACVVAAGCSFLLPMHPDTADTDPSGPAGGPRPVGDPGGPVPFKV